MVKIILNNLFIIFLFCAFIPHSSAQAEVTIKGGGQGMLSIEPNPPKTSPENKNDSMKYRGRSCDCAPHKYCFIADIVDRANPASKLTMSCDCDGKVMVTINDETTVQQDDCKAFIGPDKMDMIQKTLQKMRAEKATK